MDTRPITPRYWVAPQLTVEDMPAIAAAGFTTVICNRPDSEVAPDLQSGAIGAAARAAGLRFEVLELTQATLTPENARRQRALIEGADGNVLAYCRSGTRCTLLWAQASAARIGAAEAIAVAGFQAHFPGGGPAFAGLFRPRISGATGRHSGLLHVCNENRLPGFFFRRYLCQTGARLVQYIQLP